MVIEIYVHGNSLLGAGKLTKNADVVKYKYSEHVIEFNARRTFSLSDSNLL